MYKCNEEMFEKAIRKLDIIKPLLYDVHETIGYNSPGNDQMNRIESIVIEIQKLLEESKWEVNQNDDN